MAEDISEPGGRSVEPSIETKSGLESPSTPQNNESANSSIVESSPVTLMLQAPDDTVDNTTQDADSTFVQSKDGSDDRQGKEDIQEKEDSSGNEDTSEKELESEKEDNNPEDGFASEHGEEDEEEEDDEDEPPKLKYSRLRQLPSHFFKLAPVSTAAFHDNVFLFGTHTGQVHMTDANFTTIRTFKAHKALVLCLYTDGVFFASASMDGTVVIGSIADSGDIVMLDYKRPIHAIVLDKNYQRSRSFVCGGMAGSVIYSSKNWLDQRVDTVIEADKGPVMAIQKVGDILFWMNDKGITFYNILSKQIVKVIDRPEDAHRSDLYWPRVAFPEVDRVLVAWGNYIWSVRIHSGSGSFGNSSAGSFMKSRILPSASSLSFRLAPEIKIEVEHVFKTDFLVSGIAGFSDDQWIALAYNPPAENQTGTFVSQNPDIRILSSVKGDTVFEEELEFNAIDNLGLNDYNLFAFTGVSSTRYILLSARDCVIADQLQPDDRLHWYLEHEQFDKAWLMSQHLVSPLKRVEFGYRHSEFLIDDNQWDEAATWLSRILYIPKDFLAQSDTRSTIVTRVSKTLQAEEMEAFAKEVSIQWNRWSNVFLDAGHFRELITIIPTDARFGILKNVYTQILESWLGSDLDAEELYSVLAWDPELYDYKLFTGHIEHLLETKDHVRLRRQLCAIYEAHLEPEKCIPHMCLLKDPGIVEFLNKNHILARFVADLGKFTKLKFAENDFETKPIEDIQQAVKPVVNILVDRRNEIAPSKVLQLYAKSGLKIVSYCYVESLTAIDELLIKGLEFEVLDLYSQFDRAKLLPFLSKNDEYNIDRAIELCESSGLVDELVYLLGKIGESKRALSLIVDELGEPEKAIVFAKSQNNKETWDLLLDKSAGRPNFIKALIENSDEQLSKFYNPMVILLKMTTDIHIDGLKESVAKVSADYDLNILNSQLILKIVYKRSEEISKEFHRSMLKGLKIDVSKPQYSHIFNVFETILVLKSQLSAEPTIKFVSDLVERDPQNKKAFTSLEAKLRHIAYLDRKCRAELEKDSAGGEPVETHANGFKRANMVERT